MPAAIPTSTRAVIFEAATDLFAEYGYARTTVRQIARRAEVDPALVMRHFRSKEQLFLETIGRSAHLTLPLTGPVATLGWRITHALMTASPQLRQTYLALLRASDVGPVGSVLRHAHLEHIAEPLRQLLDGTDAPARAHAAAAAIGGLVYALWLIEDPGFTGPLGTDAAKAYAAALQNILDGAPEGTPKET